MTQPAIPRLQHIRYKQHLLPLVIPKGRRTGHDYSKGPVPFGYAAVMKKLEPNPSELRTVGVILALAKYGLSCREIADYLNRNQYPAKKLGRQWDERTVRVIVKREAPLEESAVQLVAKSIVRALWSLAHDAEDTPEDRRTNIENRLIELAACAEVHWPWEATRAA